MEREEFKVLMTGLVTFQGRVLLGKKIEKEGHPVSGEWHIPGGFLEEGEELDEALRRELREEADLEVEVHQIICANKLDFADAVRIIIHCEADSREVAAGDDLQEVKWVEPGQVDEYLENDEAKNRKEVRKFLEKLEKMPSF